MTNAYPEIAATDIAIVAATCRFPGVDSVSQLHVRLCSGQPVTHEVPQQTAPDETKASAGYVPIGSTIHDIEYFDPAPFGMSTREAELLDPQARILHELALQALDAAGHSFGQGVERAGVIMGGTHPAFLHDRFPDFDPLGTKDPIATMETSLGSYLDYLATGIAHRLRLTGPAFTVQTACSSSLVAIHLGIQQLLAGESDLVLAGGATIHVPQGKGYQHVPDGPFSADGRTRPYSVAASGAVFTQGAGVVALRRAQDALADGDPILAIIRGSAVNNDGGRSAGLVAPSKDAHVEVIREAQAMADVMPEDVTYLEGHGTGTPVGDPLEYAAFAEVFGTAQQPWCTLGSAKAILGHTEAAAGVASVLAVIGALQARTIPGTIGAEQPSDFVQLGGSAIQLAHHTKQWSAPNDLLIAGISSLGFGGTNCHMILQEAPPIRHTSRAQQPSAVVLPYSAATKTAAKNMGAALRQWAEAHPALLQQGRDNLLRRKLDMPHRGAVVATNSGVAEVISSREHMAQPRVLWAFPGGGAQKVGMLEHVIAQSAHWRAEFEQLAAVFDQHLDGDIRAICAPEFYGVPAVDASDPVLGLPALIVTEILCARMLQAAGVTPDALIGHSTGEYAAAIVAGALDVAQLAPLIAARSQSMSQLHDGAMLRIRASATELGGVLKQYPTAEVSAYNSKKSTVLSGDSETMRAIARELGEQAEYVPVATAAHSSLVEPALATVRAAARGLRAQSCAVPVYSAAVADVVSPQQLQDPEFWVQHMRQPVQFQQALEKAVADLEEPVVVLHVGPGAALAALAREAEHPKIVATVTTADDDRLLSELSITTAAAELFSCGVDLQAEATAMQPVELPPYQFDRQRLWPERPQGTGSAGNAGRDSGVVQPDSLFLRMERRSIPRQALAPSVSPRRVQLEAADAVQIVVQVCATASKLVQEASTAVVFECTDPELAAVAAATARSCQDELGLPILVACGNVSDAQASYAFAHRLTLVQSDGVRCTYQVPVRMALESESGARLPSKVLILGGRGRIGSALHRHLSALGVEVLQGTRQPDTYQVDPQDPDDIARLLRTHHCDCNTAVIIATGVVGEDAFVEADAVDTAYVHQHWDAKVAVTRAVRDACAQLGDQAPGQVLVLSSLAAYNGGVGLAAYAAANRAAELVPTPQCDTQWTAVASDGWRSGNQNSFAHRLLRESLSEQQGLDAITQLLARPVEGTVLLTARDVSSFTADPTTVASSAERGVQTPGGASSSNSNAADALGQLREMWAAVLGSDIADDADFFALGGSSLQATKLLADVREQFGVQVRLRDLLSDPTFAGMAERVAGTSTLKTPALETPAPKTPAPQAETTQTIAANLPTVTGPESYATWPLTPVQRAYLTGRSHAFGLNANPCHSFVETFVPTLDIAALNTAIRTVIARHPMLRAIVNTEGHHAITPSEYQVPVSDCRKAADPEQALARWRQKNQTRRGAADQWPLVAIAVAIMPDGYHIGWSIDVLVCDASSFGVLFAEISAAYAGRALGPAPQRHFAEHVAQLQVRTEDEQFWKDLVPTLPPAPALGAQVQDIESFHRYTHVVDAALVEQLEDAARSFKTTVTSLFLCAYAMTLARWTEQSAMSIMLTVFDRPSQFEGVIGDFTCLVPCPLSLSGEVQQDVHTVSSALFEVLDHGSVSGPDILAMKSALDGETFRLPVVFTSTLGTQVDGGSGDHGLGRLVGGASQTPQVVLDHQIFQWEDRLHVQFDAAESVLSPEQLDDFVQLYLECLASISAPDFTDAKNLGHSECGEHDDCDEDGTARLEQIIEVWQQVLGGDEVAADAQWPQLGGDSLDAIRLVARLNTIGVATTLEEVLGGITPAELVQHSSDTAVVELQRHPADAPFDLTPLQQAYLVGSSGGWDYSHQSAHFYVDYFDPDVTYEAMRQAVAALVRHQPMLRAVVTEDGQQRVLDPQDPVLRDVPVEVVDLHAASAVEVEAAIDEVRAQWSVAPIDPHAWPTFRVLVHELSGGGGRVHVQASLLFVDGWSFYLFFEQLFMFLDNPNTVLPQPSLSFADYLATTAALDEQRRIDDQQWWEQQLPSLPVPPSLPHMDERGTQFGMRRHAGRITAERAEMFFDVCKQNGTTPTAVIGAAWTEAVCAWSGDEELLLAVLYFNRKAVAEDVDRILGPFATTALVHCRPQQWGADAPDGFGTAMTDALAHASVSGIEVARLLSRYRGSHEVVAPVVFTSTLGFADDASTAATARVDETDVYERVVTPQVLLDLQASMENGTIAINLDSPHGAFEPDATEVLVQHVLHKVDEYIDQGRWVDEGVVLQVASGAADRATSTHHVVEANDTAHTLVAGCSPESLAACRSQFAKVLGHEVAPEQDVYAAGGDSLAMVRIIAGLRTQHQLDISLEQFLEEPSPAGVAARAMPMLDTAVHVLPLADGEGEPLYLLHPSGGDVLCYMGLARQLAGRPVYAVADPGLEGTPMPVDLDNVAHTYAELILAHRKQLADANQHGLKDEGQGLCIGGWSMGGTVAQRVVVQLQQRQIAVAALVLIDSNSPDRIRALTAMDEQEVDAEFARRYLRSLQAFGANTVDDSLVGRANPAPGVTQALGAQGLSTHDVERRLAVFTRHLVGLAALQAQPLEQVATLLVIADEQSPANAGVGMGVDDARDAELLGWGENLPETTRQLVVPGHHYSVLAEPSLGQVAQAILELLDEQQGN